MIRRGIGLFLALGALAFAPQAQAKRGPACKKIDDAANKSAEIKVTADVVVDDGGPIPAGPVTITAHFVGLDGVAAYDIHNLSVREEQTYTTSDGTKPV